MSVLLFHVRKAEHGVLAEARYLNGEQRRAQLLGFWGRGAFWGEAPFGEQM